MHADDRIESQNNAPLTATSASSTTTGSGNRTPGWRTLLATPLLAGLAGLLVLQLLAALVLGLGGGDLAPAPSEGELIAFEPGEVETIRIAARGGDPIALVRGESGWRIPVLADFPASQSEVDGLLERLDGLQRRLPVATSAEARERFRVSDATFERRVTLEGADGTLGSLYLGDSPGFRRIFVRVAGEDAVYEAEMGLFDVPAEAGEWANRTALHLERETLARIELADVALERADEGWQVADLAAGEEADPEAVDEAVRKVTGVNFREVLAAEGEPAYESEAPVFEYRVVPAEGDTVVYRLFEPTEGDGYVLEVSDRPHRFALTPFVGEGLAGLSRAEVLKDPEDGGEIAEAEPARSNTKDAAAATAPTGESDAGNEPEAESESAPAAAQALTEESEVPGD